MKKLLLSTITCLATSTFAVDLKIEPEDKRVNEDTQLKLEGLFNFQAGISSQKNLVSEDNNVSANRRNIAFYTESYFAATLEQKAGDLAYGGKIVLVPTTKANTAPSMNGSHIFLKSEFGKTEIGSPYDAASKLRVMGDDVAAGGAWSKFIKLDHTNMKYNGVAAEVSGEDYFFDGVFKTELKQIHDNAEPARKVSYYTPNLNGFQAGISYMPDSGNTGGGAIMDSASTTGITEVELTDSPTPKKYIINRNVKDAFSGGVSYEHNISDGVDLKVAATGEYGKPVGNIKLIENKGEANEKVLNQYKLSSLRTFSLGANLTYGNFSYGASFGSLGKSLTAAEYNQNGRDTKYYNGAIAYGQGLIKTSLSYFKSNKYKNVLDSVTLGSEFKLAPGLLPYGEVSYFEAKGKPSLYPEAPKKKTKGTIVVLGAKLKF